MTPPRIDAARRFLVAATAAALVASAQTPSVPIGGAAPHVRWFDGAGSSAPWTLPEGASFAVAIWFHTACPVVRASLEEIAALVRDAGPKGVAFVLVDAHPEPPEAVRAFAEARLPGVPFAFDRDGEAARAFGVKRVPTAIVIDAARRLRYRGRIFERFTNRDEGLPEAGRLDLRLALEDLSAGREPVVSETRTAGCLVPPAPASRTTTPLTFAKDVAPLLAKHCVACHVPGGSAPMPFRTYAEVRPYVHDVAEVVWDGMMPPWREDGHGLKLMDERRLTDGEKGIVLRWVQGGAPEGPPLDAPLEPPRREPSFAASFAAATFELAVPPFGRGLRLETTHEARLTFGDDAARGAAAFMLSVDPPSAVVSADLRTKDGAPLAFLKPGEGGLRLPAGAAFAGSKSAEGLFGLDVRATFVLRPDGATTRATARLHVLPAGLGVLPRVITMRPEPASIPAGDSNATFVVERTLERGADLVSFTPHLRHLGRQVFVDAFLPDGSTKRLCGASRWDPRLRAAWRPVAPWSAPAGTRLRFTAVYDNSAANPRNPERPPRETRFGDGPRDEACALDVLLVER